MKPPEISIQGNLKKLLKSCIEQAREDLFDDYEGSVSELHDDNDIEVCDSLVISAFYSQLEDFRKYIEDNYKSQLRRKQGQWYPRKWMIEDRRISSILDKYKICDILNTLEKKRYSRKEGKMIYCYLTPPIIGEFATFIANADFYKAILPELGMAQITLQKRIAALCKAGVFQLVAKDGRNHIPVYAIGTFSDYRGSAKLNRFLTKENKDALLLFKP